MFKRPHYIVVGGVVLLGIVLVALPKQTSAQIKLALSSLFLPLFGMAGAGSKAADKAADLIMPRRVLEAQLDALKKENTQLKFDLIQHERVVAENDQLRAQIAWQRRMPWSLKLARVLTHDPANWWRTLTIDAGSRDGIAPNMPVLTMTGLVGRVDEVGYTSSRIVLLGDPNCRVSAMVVGTGDRGVIAPSSSSVIDPTLAALTYLPRNSTNRPGAMVVTSGAGGIFPGGILVGRIADLESVGQGLYMEARVKLAADLQRLDMVWVILGGTK
jgi:rod shape-determining protein MreC